MEIMGLSSVLVVLNSPCKMEEEMKIDLLSPEEQNLQQVQNNK